MHTGTVQYDKTIAVIFLPKVGLYRVFASFGDRTIQPPVHGATCCIELTDEASQGLSVSIVLLKTSVRNECNRYTFAFEYKNTYLDCVEYRVLAFNLTDNGFCGS
jgi:hypothetical protein